MTNETPQAGKGGFTIPRVPIYDPRGKAAVVLAGSTMALVRIDKAERGEAAATC